MLFVSRPAEGGIRRHLKLLRCELKSRGVDIAVAGPDASEAATYPCNITDGIHPGSDFVACRQIREAISHFGPDVVHYHGFKAALLGRSLNVDGIPAVCTLHGFMLRDGIYKRVGPLMAAVERWQSRRTDAYIAVSNALKQHFVQSVGLPEAKIVVIPNPVEVPPVEAIGSRPAGSLQVIGTSGRLVREKGLDTLIDAVKALGDAAPVLLRVAGDGPAREELQQRVRKHHLESKVTFLGYVDDMYGFFAGIDVYVQPSVSEGFGLACAEAMAMGIPVVVSDAGGLSELAGHGEFGLVFPTGRTEALSQAISRLLADKELRDELGQKGRESILLRFSPAGVADKTLALYQSILDRTT